MDKIVRILDAINNPEKYSTVEIEEILEDGEAKEILDLFDKTKSSLLQQVPFPDIEDEWIKFKHKNHSKREIRKLSLPKILSGKIAVSITVAIISITSVAAIVGMSVKSLNTKENISSGKEFSELGNVIINQGDSIKTTSSTPTLSIEPVIFDNELLGAIMNQIGDFYGYKIEFKNDNATSLRLYFKWKQASSINEVVESLNNFEQIHLTIEGKTIKID